MTFPLAPGFKGEADTGPESADLMAGAAGRYRRLVLGVTARRRDKGCTPEEAVDETGVPRTTLQPRFSELKTMGLLVDSGIRRKNASGRRAVVWVLPEYKREEVA